MGHDHYCRGGVDLLHHAGYNRVFVFLFIVSFRGVCEVGGEGWGDYCVGVSISD